MADVEVTVSPVPELLVHSGLKLKNAARGVYFDTSSSIAGAVGALDFANESIKRFTVTGDLTGSFTFPPINFPPLEADNQSVILTVILVQDGTGSHALDLDTLFLNANEILGTALTDETANGVTVVDVVARRESSLTTFTANFAPTFDAGQIDTGLIAPARLPAATPTTIGAVALASGSGAAAAGDHVHALLLAARITIRMSDGGTITNGDYTLLDMPTSGTVVRLTGLQLTGTSTATVTAKISGTSVTGTGTAATSTAESADAAATAQNTFVARQRLQINIAAITGTPTMLSGWLHYSVNTNAWVP